MVVHGGCGQNSGTERGEKERERTTTPSLFVLIHIHICPPPLTKAIFFMLNRYSCWCLIRSLFCILSILFWRIIVWKSIEKEFMCFSSLALEIRFHVQLDLIILFFRDFGSKTGSGPMASASVANVDRRERLRRLALETIDLTKVWSDQIIKIEYYCFYLILFIYSLCSLPLCVNV
jgi:hypothetical protein